MCATQGNCSSIPLHEYDAKFTAAWLEQTESIPDSSQLGQYITDTQQLRGAVRACKGQ